MITRETFGQNVCGIAIGIRFNQTFAIGDNLGKIADKILYSKQSYFNPQFFPLVDSGIHSIVLKDEPLNRYLVISHTDIILEVKKMLNAEDRTKLEQEYEKQVLKLVFSTYQVRDIQRIGYLTKYQIHDKKIADTFCAKSGVDANNLTVRFQKNYPMPEAMLKKDVNDYCSNICTIEKKADLDELTIYNDYQIHFTPFLDNYEDVQFNAFLKSKKIFNEEKLPEILSRFLIKV